MYCMYNKTLKIGQEEFQQAARRGIEVHITMLGEHSQIKTVQLFIKSLNCEWMFLRSWEIRLNVASTLIRFRFNYRCNTQLALLYNFLHLIFRFLWLYKAVSLLIYSRTLLLDVFFCKQSERSRLYIHVVSN